MQLTPAVFASGALTARFVLAGDQLQYFTLLSHIFFRTVAGVSVQTVITDASILTRITFAFIYFPFAAVQTRRWKNVKHQRFNLKKFIYRDPSYPGKHLHSYLPISSMQVELFSH